MPSFWTKKNYYSSFQQHLAFFPHNSQVVLETSKIENGLNLTLIQVLSSIQMWTSWSLLPYMSEVEYSSRKVIQNLVFSIRLIDTKEVISLF